MRRRIAAYSALLACIELAACRMHRAGAISLEPLAELRVDSAQYAVRSTGLMSRVDIPYTYTNHSGGTVSESYCHAPTPPALEKQQPTGRWVRAYSPVQLLCESLPPFRIANGKTYHGILHVVAAARGNNIGPEWLVDSIPGTYHLRWDLHAGADPTDSRGTVSATSPAFRLIVP